MPKYKNTKIFAQPLVVHGKRVIIRPGEVIQSSKELDLSYAPFLEKVSDDTPLQRNPPTGTPVKKINPAVEKVKTELATAKGQLEEHKKLTQETIEDHKKTTEEKLDTILRRLEIMKTAIETTTQALQNLEEVVYNDVEYVIDEHEETTEGEKK
jgi:hypothetical protein